MTLPYEGITVLDLTEGVVAWWSDPDHRLTRS